MVKEQVIDTDGQILTKTTYAFFGYISYCNSKGEYHRIGGPAYIESDGTQEYWVKGKSHRTDGPAYIGSDGSKWYYVDGKKHRTDGPAVIRSNGTLEYWVDNIEYAQEEYPQAVFKYKLKQLVG